LTTKKKRFRLYFFLNGQPHKKIQVNNPLDRLVAWNYTERKRVAYSLSAARKNIEPAFTTGEVEAMVGRHRVSMLGYIAKGLIKPPFKTYSLDGQFKPGMYVWCEKDIIGLWEMLLYRVPGARRKDGLSKSTRLPSKAELMAMIRNEVVLYAKTSNGEFTPVWQAKDWQV
jgi:hypothetical protein